MQMHAAEQRPPQSVTCWAAAGQGPEGAGAHPLLGCHGAAVLGLLGVHRRGAACRAPQAGLRELATRTDY